MFNRILVATDLTPASVPALRAAYSLSRKLGVPLTVLHVTEPPYEARAWFSPIAEHEVAFYRTISQREQEASERALGEAVAALGPEASAEVKTIVTTGIAADIIPLTAQELGANLIVIGTHGRRGVRHALLGSIAERVVRTAHCPVMTIPMGPQPAA